MVTKELRFPDMVTNEEQRSFGSKILDVSGLQPFCDRRLSNV